MNRKKKVIKNKYRLLGWIMLAISVSALILSVFLRKAGYEYIAALLPAVSAAGGMFAAMWLYAGHSEKVSKQFDADYKDERTKLIRGRSALPALYTVLILLLALGVWLGVHEYVVIGFVVFGIFFVGLIIFAIRQAILEKRM